MEHIRDYEEKQRKIQALKPIDDVFFQKLMENREVCEEMLRVILEDENLRVERVIPQYSIKNLRGRSVRLDAYCELSGGRKANVEVQKANDDDHLRRARYNAACITVENTGPSDRFEDVPDVIVVYISRFDMFKRGRTIYHVEPTIVEFDETVDNGQHYVFANTAVKDGSAISELMECMEQESIDHTKFPKLSEEVGYYKTNEKGVGNMCDVIEEYAQKRAEETAIEIAGNLLSSGLPLEDIAKYSGLSLEKVQELAGKKGA